MDLSLDDLVSLLAANYVRTPAANGTYTSAGFRVLCCLLFYPGIIYCCYSTRYSRNKLGHDVILLLLSYSRYVSSTTRDLVPGTPVGTRLYIVRPMCNTIYREWRAFSLSIFKMNMTQNKELGSLWTASCLNCANHTERHTSTKVPAIREPSGCSSSTTEVETNLT